MPSKPFQPRDFNGWVPQYAEQMAIIANARFHELLGPLKFLVETQAEDEGLWSVPAEGTQRIAEAYLQQELRKLHAAIEKVIE